MVKEKIYIVEDDENIRELVLYALRSNGFEALGFESSRGFFEELGKNATCPALILLDIMLPEEDGLSVLKRLRGDGRYQKIPVIMLTAKGSEFDRVKGLDMGADDYVTKPFGVMELLARIKAVLRRSGAGSEKEEKFCCGDIVLDHGRHIVSVGGETVNLTFKEYELLLCLMRNAGLVVSRDKIMDLVWGYDFTGESRTVDAHIKTLRQKLGTAGDHIKTIRNVGYKMGE